MEPVSPTLLSLLWLPFAIGLLLLPGWVLARRLASPSPVLTGAIASAAILFNLVLLLNGLGLPLHAGTIGLGLVVIAAGCWKLPQRPAVSRPGTPGLRGSDWLWLLAPLFAVASIAGRALLDPLSGHDNDFRWDYLARLVLAQRSLHGYPPTTAADFEYYGWCDGIPPLVPLINFWIYAATGSVAPMLTAIRVMGETILLGLGVYRLAQLLWTDRGALPAVAALSASALGMWSLAMGQETGLTALSLVVMLYLLEWHAREPQGGHELSAAVAAGVGALSRDYTLAFPLLGLALLIWRGTTRRSAAGFALTAGAVCLPWYLRNWTMTGNPLYPHTLAGLLPGNAVHDELMRYIAEWWSPFSGVHAAWLIPLFLTVLAGVPIVLGVIGMLRAGRSGVALAAGILVMGALWALALPHTGGGWIYAFRVLLPGIALLAALGGWIGTARVPWRVAVALIVTTVSFDAARRSWLLPESPTSSPWSFSFDEWRRNQQRIRLMEADGTWRALVRHAGGAGIVVDHPSRHALITMQGGTAVPWFSPLLAPTFDDGTSFDGALAQLRQADVRFVALTLSSPMTQRLTKAHPFWTQLLERYPAEREIGNVTVFDLQREIRDERATPPVR